MAGQRPLVQTLLMCVAAAVTLAGAISLLIGTWDRAPGSTAMAVAGARSSGIDAASFALRFGEAAALATRPLVSDIQVAQARAALSNALRAQQFSNATAQDVELSPKALSVPVPKARPVDAQYAQGIAPTSGDQRQASDDAIKSPLEKVMAFLQPSGPQLASIAPDGGVTDDGRAIQPGAFDKYTAVYDISGKVVHMPDGTRLEAHSGLGELMDDPDHVAVKNRGPTPPNVYELKMRERRFHGVQAIRMRPIGNGDLFGRTGLLTHSYLMGPNGDSNGCVSFKDYDVFLQAFLRGDVKRLVVVKSLTIEANARPAKA